MPTERGRQSPQWTGAFSTHPQWEQRGEVVRASEKSDSSWVLVKEGQG